MRLLICLMLIAPCRSVAAPVASRLLATDWGQYDNARFGYTIDVPPGVRVGKEADNGDGRAFRGGASKLLVWGGNITEDSFEERGRLGQGLCRG